MKKTQLKRKNSLRRKPLRKVSTSSFSTELKKTDLIFSQYVRLSNADKNGMVKCFTCDKIGFWKRDIIETGHYYSRSNYAVRFSLLNAHPQCITCNRLLHGNLEVYKINLKDKLKTLNSQLKRKTSLTIKILITLRKKYTKLVENLKNELK